MKGNEWKQKRANITRDWKEINKCMKHLKWDTTNQVILDVISDSVCWSSSGRPWWQKPAHLLVLTCGRTDLKNLPEDLRLCTLAYRILKDLGYGSRQDRTIFYRLSGVILKTGQVTVTNCWRDVVSFLPVVFIPNWKFCCCSTNWLIVW